MGLFWKRKPDFPFISEEEHRRRLKQSDDWLADATARLTLIKSWPTPLVILQRTLAGDPDPYRIAAKAAAEEKKRLEAAITKAVYPSPNIVLATTSPKTFYSEKFLNHLVPTLKKLNGAVPVLGFEKYVTKMYDYRRRTWTFRIRVEPHGAVRMFERSDEYCFYGQDELQKELEDNIKEMLDTAKLNALGSIGWKSKYLNKECEMCGSLGQPICDDCYQSVNIGEFNGTLYHPVQHPTKQVRSRAKRK
jgi:hypothetical protein